MKFLSPLFFVFLSLFAHSQDSEFKSGSAWALKAGMGFCSQKWNGSQREPILSPVVAASWELLTAKRTGFCFDLQYLQKGSAQRRYKGAEYNINGQPTGNTIIYPRRKTVFNEINLLLAAKSRYNLSEKMSLYYLLGIRGGFTVVYDLDVFSGFENDVRRFQYGVTVGLGTEFQIKKSNSAIFWEVKVEPDLSDQIAVRGYPNYTTSYGGITYTYNLPEQHIRNFAVSLTLGYRKASYDEEVPEDF